MIQKLKKIGSSRYGLTLFAYLTAAAAAGVASVWFMRSFEFVQDRRMDFGSIGAWRWLTTPLLFLASVELIRRLAPCAAGTGIPQAVFAAKHGSPEAENKLRPLLSPLTVAVKIIALLIGILAGASTGREGPTVHIACGVFVGVLMAFRRFTGLQIDFRSAVVAGGAAGLGAAFNTPLAGVTFAIEELTVDYFSSIKDFVLMAIIVAAIAAKSLTGEYTYFGRLQEPGSLPLSGILIVGILGGLLGAAFSTSILFFQGKLAHYKEGFGRYLVPTVLALGLLAVASVSARDVLGPGNDAAQALVQGQFGDWSWLFPLQKIAATLFTYCSGIAGGIFAPALSIGAALGADVGQCLGFPIASCALVGMAAFLSGTIQAPITAFVILFEMTGHHGMLIPIMLASLIAFMVARLVKSKHLYQSLAENYRPLLD